MSPFTTTRANAAVKPAPPNAELDGKTKLADTRVDGQSTRDEGTKLETLQVETSPGRVMQADLMSGRTNSGVLVFYLQGQGKNYALLGADGKPVTNAIDAEARAIKLIENGGATQLRELMSRSKNELNVSLRSEGKKQFDAKTSELQSTLGKTEVKPNEHPDGLDGMAYDARLNVNKAISFGNNIAHGNIAPQVGEAIKFVTGGVKQINSAVQGAPKYAERVGNLLSGRDKTTPGEVLTGGAGGIGQTAWGWGSTLLHNAARVVVPGKGSDAVEKLLGQGYSWLGTNYRKGLEQDGVNTKSTGYQAASATVEIAATVAVPVAKGVMKAYARPTTKIQLVSSARPAAMVQQNKSAVAEVKNAVTAYDGLGANASQATRAAAAQRVMATQQDVNSLRDQHRANGTWSAKDKQQYLNVMKEYGPRADQIGGAYQRGQSPHTSDHASTSKAAPEQPPTTQDNSKTVTPAPSDRGVTHREAPTSTPPELSPSTDPTAGVGIGSAALTIAQNLTVPLNAVRETINGIGSAVTNAQMADTLRRRYRLSTEDATAVVRSVRQVQGASTRAVVRILDETAKRKDAHGNPDAHFTLEDWKRVAPYTVNTPKADNGIARKLLLAVTDARYFKGEKSTFAPKALAKVAQYLRNCGYDLSSTWRGAFNVTAADVHLSRTLAMAGLRDTQLVVGVLDHIGSTGRRPHAGNAANEVRVTGARMYNDASHGDGVVSLVSRGAGGRMTVLSATTSEGIPSGLERMLANGATVINWSGFLRDDNARALAALATKYPNVQFVVSAGNGSLGDGVGRDSRTLPLDNFGAYRLPNVLYVGNVRGNGEIDPSSNHGPAVTLYAPGKSMAAVSGNRYEVVMGTSASAPAVSRALSVVKALGSTVDNNANASPLGNAEALRVVMVTADRVQQPNGKSILVLNENRAISLAGAMGISSRTGVSLEAAFDRLKVSAQERYYLLPRARQLQNAPATARSAPTKAPRQTGLVSRATDLPQVHGHKLDDKTLRALTGNLPGTLISAKVKGLNLIEVQAVRTTDSRQALTLHIDLRDNKLVLADTKGFWRDKRSQGGADASSIFSTVLEQAQRMGLARAEVQYPNDLWTERSGHLWLAERGFTGIQDDHMVAREIPTQYEVNGRKPNDIDALMSTAHGRVWWKVHGKNVSSLTFDLHEGSHSWARLRERVPR